MTNLPPPKTPTVAIARVLRGLGLTQGRGQDFRVEGQYRNGERVGTYVLVLTRHADETIAAHADEIERLTGETGWAFRVSIRYQESTGRPMTSVANYGARVRQAPPAVEEKQPAVEPAPEPAPAEAEPEPAPAAEAPPAGSKAARFLEGARERAWGRKRAGALGWSTAQADLMAAAAAIQLQYRADGVLRLFPRPGAAGAVVAEGRLTPLIGAGLLVITEPYGPGSKRVSITADGREALRLWRVYRPVPVPKGPQMDREPLRPLLGGELHTNQTRAADEDHRLRVAEREAMYAALEELHAWEERTERAWNAWARVQGITHRLGRTAPAGWVPTEEEIAEHRLDPDVVAELRALAEGAAAPKPELPATVRPAPKELPPPTVAPDEVEQLDLFGDVA